ncbi:hypothetical protein [Luteolibacter sp. LG18]|uniref:hypothetical protein n=1 Tax=Luteolibacter sp. LG18 TaxID=2819286 RepID=UPI002B299558|nr:hypothetical protein llg_22220 [Luteolibacter sp. LG18]
MLLPLVLLLALTGGLFWWFSPEQVVKRRTKELLGVFTLAPGTSKANRELGALKLTGLIGPRLEVDVPEAPDASGSFGRADVESGFHALCGMAKETRFSIQKFNSITLTNDQATVSATLDALVDLNSYRPADGPGEATFVWNKTKDGWQVTTIVWRENKR